MANAGSTNLTQGKVTSTLVKFAIPLAMSSILQVLYGIVDTIVAGHMIGSSGLSAVTNGSFLILVVTYFSQGIGTGGNILISQYFGAKDEMGRKQTTGTLITVEMLLGVFFMVLVFCLRSPLVSLLNVPAHEEACQYVAICSVGLIFTYGYNGISAVLRSMGNSRQPMYFIIIATVVNIVLDVWFVAGLGWGVAGTAYATVAAQFVTFAASVVYVLMHREYYGINMSFLGINVEKLLRILKLGIPSTLLMVVNGISWMVITAFINKYGITYSAAAGAVNKIRELLLQIVLALSNGASIMIGQCIGADLYDRCRKIVKITVTLSLGLAVGLIVIVELIAPLLVSIFVSEADVIAQGTIHLRIEALCLIGYALNAAFKSSANGAGKVIFCLIDVFVAAIVTRVLLTVILDAVLGVTGVYWSCAIAMLPAFPLALWYHKSGRWMRGKAIH